jgi:type VI secretion system protein ImpM
MNKAGWFGKLASQGDFANRRLPPAWVQACDSWLSAALASSQQQLGPVWLERYLSAPVWRFAWGPQIGGDGLWWFGVLMPSCDNVGRYFPLVVAQSRPAPPMDRVGLDHLEAWWYHLARAAFGTLGEGATLASFEDMLDQAPPWPGRAPGPMQHPIAPPGGSGGLHGGAHGGPWRQPLPEGARLPDLVQAVAAGALMLPLVQGSFWWPLSREGEGGSFTLVPGLPPPEAFAAMLTGQW